MSIGLLCWIRGFNLFAVDNGNIVMKHENGVSYRATGEVKFRA